MTQLIIMLLVMVIAMLTFTNMLLICRFGHKETKKIIKIANKIMKHIS